MQQYHLSTFTQEAANNDSIAVASACTSQYMFLLVIELLYNRYLEFVTIIWMLPLFGSLNEYLVTQVLVAIPKKARALSFKSWVTI